MKSGVKSLRRVYGRFLKRYGRQRWWPGETSFEVAVGAILTQNVSWTNVEKSIRLLKAEGLLTPRALYALSPAEIAPFIRSTGYFNQKALKLRRFMEWFRRYGFSFKKLAHVPVELIREELLGVNGIGPETADSILLYALAMKIFVVDAYTLRIFTRMGLLGGDEGYEEVQGLFHRRFAGGAAEYNEFHALIVRHGKEVCRKSPRCRECCIGEWCDYAMSESIDESLKSGSTKRTAR